MIVLPNGLNVYPEDVQQALQGPLGDAAESVVLGLPDESGGERVHAALLPTARDEDTPSRLAAGVRRANQAADRKPGSDA